MSRTVRLRIPTTVTSLGARGTTMNLTFLSGIEYAVVRESTHKLLLRGTAGLTGWVSKDLVYTTPPTPPRRPRGTPPEGGISIDDERIQWIWEDAHELAEERDLCHEYDDFAEALGLPPRPKEFRVEFTIILKDEDDVEPMLRELPGYEKLLSVDEY